MSTRRSIIYILNARWPTIRAHGLQVAKTCEALGDMGAHVTLVVPARGSYEEQRDRPWREIYDVKDSFRVIRLASPDWVASGIVGRVLFALQQVFFAIRAARWMRDNDGIVYSRDVITLATAAVLMPSRRLFWELHKWPRRIGFLYRSLFERLCGLIVITQGLADNARELGIPAERIAVIPDAVDPDTFDIPQTIQEAREAVGLVRGRWIGYVGHLSTYGEAKGVDTLIRALQHIVDARLLIVGGTKQEIDIHNKIAAQVGVADRIHWAGIIPHTQVPLWLRACDVLAMPYPNTPHYAYYMSPLKLFEYMAAGKPVVATDLPSVREVVSDDDVYFSEPGDDKSIAAALTRALSAPDSAEKARRTLALAKRYSWRSRADSIITFLNTP